MSAGIAVLDANVLVPIELADLLLQVAYTEAYLPVWSDQILDEAIRNVPGHIQPEKQFDAIRTAFDDALVNPPPSLIAGMTNHSKDRHVLACAVAAGADLIVTWNLTDFKPEACSLHGVEAITPDELLRRLVNDRAHLVAEALAAISARRSNPPMTVAEIIHRLSRANPPIDSLTPLLETGK